MRNYLSSCMFILCLLTGLSLQAQDCDGGTVSTADGSDVVYTCPGDSIADVIAFAHETSSTSNYAYVVTDLDGVILGLPPANEVDFEGAGSGTCLVWGLSYEGSITASVGDTATSIALADSCFDLSDNFVTVKRGELDGGMIYASGERLQVNTCPGDSASDIVMFSSSSNSLANFQLVVTDTEGNVLGLPPGNEVDFEGAGVGTCLAWNLYYTGDLLVSVGDNATDGGLASGCYALSDTFVTITRGELDGGMIYAEGETLEVTTCPGDGAADVVSFNYSTTSEANFQLVITDTDGNILGLPPANEADFEGAGPGTCLAWALFYTGDLTAAVGDNATDGGLASGCYALSDTFVTVNRVEVDGGMIYAEGEVLEVSTCPGDGADDVIAFNNSSDNGEGVNYQLVVTDTEGNILGLPPGNEVNFEGAGPGTCLAWNLYFTGDLNAAVGDNALDGGLATGCYALSDTFVTINRIGVDGGVIYAKGELSEVTTCPGDGVDDIISFSHSSDNGEDVSYQLVVTDLDGNILGLPPGNEVNFEGAGPGTCLAWNLYFTGDLNAAVGDNALAGGLATGCYALSEEAVTINRIEVDGGMIYADGEVLEVTTCPGDGVDDIVNFNSSSDNGEGVNFQLVITDTDGNILGLPPGTEANFEGAGGGTCLAWNLYFTGDLDAAVGDNALDGGLATGCYALSDTFVTINRIEIDGGDIYAEGELMEVNVCAGDGVDDVITFINSAVNVDANYQLVITDDAGVILGLPPGNEVNFEGAGAGTCLAWNLYFTGDLTAELGDNALDGGLATGCYALSDMAVTINRRDNCIGTSVTSFTLINADTDEDLLEMYDGIVIDVADLGVKPQRLNIRANVEGQEPGSVVFGFDTNSEYSIEQIFPYALGGDTDGSGDYNPTGNVMNLGMHTVTATPYSSYQGMGVSGFGLSVKFTLVDGMNRVGDIGMGDGFIFSRVYPNPTKDNVIVSMSDGIPGVVNVSVFNMMGKIIQRKSFESKTGNIELDVDLSKEPLGFYLIRVQNGNDVFNARVQKQ